MPVTHEPWLVALSLVVAIQGAYVGLSFATRVAEATGLRRRLLLAAAATSLAVAIWAMHFVGMLAARLPFPIDYLVFPTLLSFLVCVLVVGVGVFAASAGTRTPARLAAAAVFMGGGIASMHYIGMWALHASAHMVHAPAHVVASVAIAIAASGLALGLAAGSGGRPPLFLSATAFGIAVTGMHYTAMAGLTLHAHASPMTTAPALSSDLLAIVVAVVAFLVSGIFLLALVPERPRVTMRQAATADSIGAAMADGRSEATEVSVEVASAGAGIHVVKDEPTPAPQRGARRIPVERDGITHFFPVDDIVAVHANAHYTYIFDGAAKLFCPLPISDVEARLDASRFIRVHRSHIVNVDRIVGLRRAGDSGLIELAAADRYTVPVSRSRVGWLKSRLKLGEVVS
jgi:NO-binding membrane sensor protein with MHYT domain